VSARGLRHDSRQSSIGLGRLGRPLLILFGNRSLTWLIAAFAGLTIAEWGYVTALAVVAFRSHGSVAVGLVGFRLFFAAVGSFFSIPYIERHPGTGVLTGVAVTRAAIVAVSAALAASGAPLTSLLVLVALDAVVSAPYRPAQSVMLPALARSPRELAASAAGLSTVKTLSQGLGAVIGGFLLVVTTPATVFAGAALLFVGAGAMTMRLARVAIPLVNADASVGIRNTVRDTFEVIHQPHVGGIVVPSSTGPGSGPQRPWPS
jgi:hypothetical protein